MLRILEIDRSHLNKFTHLGEFISERPAARAFGAVEDGNIRSVLVADSTRIYYIATENDSKRGGYAKSLITYWKNCNKDSVISTAVERDNLPMIMLMLGCGFVINGFNLGWGDRRYVMSTNLESWNSDGVPDPFQLMKNDIDSFITYSYIAEVSPTPL